MRNAFWMFTVASLAAACASAPAATIEGSADAAAFDPVGTYTFSTTIQGMAVDGQMRITGRHDAWGGSAYTDVTGELPFTSVAVDGQEVRLTADTPDGTVYVRMRFSGESFTGDWSLAGDRGTLRGRRVAR